MLNSTSFIVYNHNCNLAIWFLGNLKLLASFECVDEEMNDDDDEVV